jgi:hypothetical protein
MSVPGTLNYPSLLDDAVSLIETANNATTTLSSSINSAVTTIPVVSTAAFPATGLVTIDSERISYTGKTSNTFTGASRGFEATSSASHSSGATVDILFTSMMLDTIQDGVIAVETKLGTGADTPTNQQVLIGNTSAGSSHWRALSKADIADLSNVDNTTDEAKPISTATQTALNLKATVASPTFTGTPSAPTAAPGTSTTQISTTAFVSTAIAAVRDGVSTAFDTLAEIEMGLADKVPISLAINGNTLNADVTITDANLVTTDVTSNNASTSKHGFIKKLPNDATKFFNGIGDWEVPAGGGDMVLATVQTVTGAKTFGPGKLIIGAQSSPPSVVGKSFWVDADDGKLYFGKIDESAWAELFLAGVSLVNLASNVTGILPKSSGGTGTNYFPTELGYAVSDEITALEAGTTKLTFRMPYAVTLTAVRASLSTASSSGSVVIDINKSGSTILSTKLSIDVSEKTSTTAATAAVISDTALTDDVEITVDIDSAGTGAKGLKILLIGTR